MHISIAKVYNKGCVNCTLLSYKIVHSYATKLYTLVDRKQYVNFLVNNVNENQFLYIVTSLLKSPRQYPAAFCSLLHPDRFVFSYIFQL